MKRDFFQFGLIALLLLLLGTLAWLQYQWQGRISDAEQIRLQKRVKEDSDRFASGFDTQIQQSLFFQDFSETGLFKDGGVRFIKRNISWANKSEITGVFENVFRYRDGVTDRYDRDNKKFVKTMFPKGAKGLKELIGRKEVSVKKKGDFILVPVFEEKESISEVIISSSDKFETIDREEHLGRPKVIGYALVEINRKKIGEEIIKPLFDKYFAGADGVRFDVGVYDADNENVWTSGAKDVDKGDSEANLFSMRPRDFFFFEELPKEAELVAEEGGAVTGSRRSKRMVYSQIFSSKVKTKTSKSGKLNITVNPVAPARTDNVTLIARTGSKADLWTVRVRHESGSLQNFVASTRNRNLIVSFGILGILALGIIFIVVSARRARILAQRQVDFVSSVSHEFRTPLAVIYSAGENISDGVIEDPDKLRDYGGLIKREGSKLSSMVEQILDYAGANAKKRELRKEPLDLSKIVSEVVGEYEPLLEKEGFDFETEVNSDSLTIIGDRESLLQAVRNLVANAMKYSNGTRWIKVSAIREGSNAKIRVEDKGFGISSSDRKKILEPFFRSKQVVDEQISGNGLGLSLVKKIIDEHDGDIEIESSPGNGSAFNLVFPLSEAS